MDAKRKTELLEILCTLIDRQLLRPTSGCSGLIAQYEAELASLDMPKRKRMPWDKTKSRKRNS